jgi:hypothetical protein
MRAWLGVLLVACNSGSAEPVRPVAVAPIAAPPRPAAPPPPLTAAHAGEIIALAVTPDGGAAASADRLGGLRLWPTLDGSREPVVIRGRAARSITLGRDGDGFAIGLLDAAGGVRLVRTTANGAVRGQVTAGHQPASQIEATPDGLLVLWADQTLSLLAPDGAERATLTPGPGSHVDSLVARGDRVLALVLEDKRLHGRWLDVHGGLAWGAATPAIAGAVERVALSPDGALLAVSRPRSLHPELIDLATGKPRKTALCVTRGWPREDSGETDEAAFLRDGNAPQPLGFVTPSLVACSVLGALTWWNVAGTPAEVLVNGIGLGTAPVAVTASGVVAASGPNLALGTTTSSLYLGYGLHDVNAVRVGGGAIVVNGDQRSFVLDGQLRERMALEIGRNRSDWAELVPLDDRYAVTVVTTRQSGNRELNQLAVYDGVAHAVHQKLALELRDRQLAYEPASHLFAATDGTSSLLSIYDPASHTLGPPLRIGSAILANQVFLVDPARTGGLAAVQVDTLSDGLAVSEIALADVKPGATLEPRTSYRVPGALRAVDRAGRVYSHRGEDRDDVVAYEHGKPVARLPGVATLALRPSPDGTMIAAFDAPRLVLVDATGKPRWDTAHWSGAEIAWTDDNQLVVQFPIAVATVDLATGALATRRCGLGFGLSDTTLDAGRGAASVCD